MARSMAIKIHYDHRSDLSVVSKYSRIPTDNEYRAYLDLYYDGIGGYGFHECLNFEYTNKFVKIYLPPGYIPGKEDEEYIIFTFTYKGDQELPSHIIGIHAGASIINKSGIERGSIKKIKGAQPLTYHAEAKADLTTLFSTPIKYDYRAGKHTKIYKQWGSGLRYIDSFSKAIIIEALENAKLSNELTPNTSVTREIEVLERILSKYYF